MRLILFSGSHPRHIYVHKKMLEHFNVVGVVCMQREELMPEPPMNCDPHDTELFLRHFDNRNQVECSAYGDLEVSVYRDNVPTLFVDRSTLNTVEVLNFVKNANADACFIFGSGIIKSPVIDALPNWKLNLHLGLSPWYRGSATLFWPFYFMKPQYAGSTLHQITLNADAGDIVHQTVPELKHSQTIHEVGANCVLRSTEDVVKVFKRLECGEPIAQKKQRTHGRLFLSRDFEPHHLRVNYDLFNDKMVDYWLKGQLGKDLPKLINAIPST